MAAPILAIRRYSCCLAGVFFTFSCIPASSSFFGTQQAGGLSFFRRQIAHEHANTHTIHFFLPKMYRYALPGVLVHAQRCGLLRPSLSLASSFSHSLFLSLSLSIFLWVSRFACMRVIFHACTPSVYYVHLPAQVKSLSGSSLHVRLLPHI
jgi:hypothetical protein